MKKMTPFEFQKSSSNLRPPYASLEDAEETKGGDEMADLVMHLKHVSSKDEIITQRNEAKEKVKDVIREIYRAKAEQRLTPKED